MKLCIFLGSVLACIGIAVWFFLPSDFVWTNDAYIEGYDVQVSADIERRITQIHVEEGQFVQKGDLLVELDASILEAKLAQANARIAVLEETVKKEQAQFAKLRDDFLIAEEEFANNIIPFLTFDHFQKDYLVGAQSVKVAEKTLEESRASREVICAELLHTKIYAPRDGYIAKRWILPGDVATIGAPLFTLHQLEFLWITANLEETKLRNVELGNMVKISVDCYPNRTFSGKVWAIKPSSAAKFALIPPSNATGNFTKVVQRIPVKILLEQPQESLYLFPGMSCEVSIQVR
ncbi:MAG: HlyD family secretion protein [Chlamydiota bacterium]